LFIPGIVNTRNGKDEKSNVFPASHYGISGDWQSETTVMVIVMFKEQEGRTQLTMQMLFASAVENGKALNLEPTSRGTDTEKSCRISCESLKGSEHK
jgi:hypothetical protein